MCEDRGGVGIGMEGLLCRVIRMFNFILYTNAGIIFIMYTNAGIIFSEYSRFSFQVVQHFFRLCVVSQEKRIQVLVCHSANYFLGGMGSF